MSEDTVRLPPRCSVLDTARVFNIHPFLTSKYIAFPPAKQLALDSMQRMLPDAAEPRPSQWFEDNAELNRRIHFMHRQADIKSLTFSITCVPSSVILMPLRFDNDQDWKISVLSYPMADSHVQAPVTLWIVGKITRVRYRDDDSSYSKRFFVHIKPLDKRAHEVANGLQLNYHGQFGYTQTPLELPDIMVNRTFVPPSNGVESLENRIYDGTETLASPRSTMSALPVGSLSDGDLVLAEVWLTRFSKNDQLGMEEAYYNLRSLCLLARRQSTVPSA